MTNPQDREDFEAWALDRYDGSYLLRKLDHGCYLTLWMNDVFTAWQAASAAKEQEIAEMKEQVANLTVQRDALMIDGPPMERGINGNGDVGIGTMREMLEDYRQAADVEARLADEFKTDAERYRYLRTGNIPLVQRDGRNWPAHGAIWLIKYHHPRGTIPETRHAGAGVELDVAIDQARGKQ